MWQQWISRKITVDHDLVVSCPLGEPSYLPVSQTEVHLWTQVLENIRKHLGFKRWQGKHTVLWYPKSCKTVYNCFQTKTGKIKVRNKCKKKPRKKKELRNWMIENYLGKFLLMHPVNKYLVKFTFMGDIPVCGTWSLKKY